MCTSLSGHVVLRSFDHASSSSKSRSTVGGAYRRAMDVALDSAGRCRRRGARAASISASIASISPASLPSSALRLFARFRLSAASRRARASSLRRSRSPRSLRAQEEPVLDVPLHLLEPRSKRASPRRSSPPAGPRRAPPRRVLEDLVACHPDGPSRLVADLGQQQRLARACGAGSRLRRLRERDRDEQLDRLEAHRSAPLRAQPAATAARADELGQCLAPSPRVTARAPSRASRAAAATAARTSG